MVFDVLAARAPPRTPLEEPTALPRPPSWTKGRRGKRDGGKNGMEGKQEG